MTTRRVAVFVAGWLVLFAWLTGYPWPDAPARAQTSGPTWTCSLDDIGATLTKCTVTPNIDPGMRKYITDVVVQSTTSTSGQFLLRTGTSTHSGGSANCGTATASLLPSAATAARLTAPANTAAPTVLRFGTPVEIAPNKDLCVLGVATNTTTIQVNGTIGAP